MKHKIKLKYYVYYMLLVPCGRSALRSSEDFICHSWTFAWPPKQFNDPSLNDQNV